MRRILTALALGLTLAVAPLAEPAQAQSGFGTFTDRNGVSCHYTQTGNFINVRCSGYTRSGVYVSYSYSCWWSGIAWNCS
jgi:hypothetical protein